MPKTNGFFGWRSWSVEQREAMLSDLKIALGGLAFVVGCAVMLILLLETL